MNKNKMEEDSMKLLIWLAIIIFYIVLSERFLKKKFKIQTKGVIVKYVNNTHKIMERMLLSVSVILLIVFVVKGINIHYWLFPYLILLFLVRCYMQWKYERERKEYILQLNGVLTLLIFITGFSLSF